MFFSAYIVVNLLGHFEARRRCPCIHSPRHACVLCLVLALLRAVHAAVWKARDPICGAFHAQTQHETARNATVGVGRRATITLSAQQPRARTHHSCGSSLCVVDSCCCCLQWMERQATKDRPNQGEVKDVARTWRSVLNWRVVVKLGSLYHSRTGGVTFIRTTEPSLLSAPLVIFTLLGFFADWPRARDTGGYGRKS
jgi:hypothetical protein